MGLSFSSLAPILGTGLGALLAAPTGGMSLGMGAMIGGMAGSSVGSAMAADEANKANIAMQRETNAMSVDMSNTAHQREVADLRAAGLNPILSAKYGGASTPGLPSPKVESLAPIIQNSAFQAQQAYLNNANLQADLAVKKASVLNSSAQAISYGEDARRKAMENDVLASEKANRDYEERRRLNRPRWQKNIGIDVQDSVSSVLGPVFKLLK